MTTTNEHATHAELTGHVAPDAAFARDARVWQWVTSTPPIELLADDLAPLFERYRAAVLKLQEIEDEVADAPSNIEAGKAADARALREAIANQTTDDLEFDAHERAALRAGAIAHAQHRPASLAVYKEVEPIRNGDIGASRAKLETRLAELEEFARPLQQELERIGQHVKACTGALRFLDERREWNPYIGPAVLPALASERPTTRKASKD